MTAERPAGTIATARRWWRAATAVLVVAAAAAAASWLRPDAGRPAAAFTLPVLGVDDARLSSADMAGEVWVLNVWASWCVPCREEHPVLLELSRRGGVPLVGLNYRDGSREAQAWLRQFGNPYRQVVADADGAVATAFGAAGVPATYVIDRDGNVRMAHAGVLSRRDLSRRVLPLLDALRR